MSHLINLDKEYLSILAIITKGKGINMLTNSLSRHYSQYKDEYEKAVLRVLESGWYVTGNELKNFENAFAQFVGTKYCIGVANGLDALRIGMHVLGISDGDEVIVQSNTYIATVMGITLNGATPVFVEPDVYFNMDPLKIESKITSKTKAVLVTHLYGLASEMEPIVALCKKYDLKLIEDCAQSHGAKFAGQMTGSFGDLACFSFYPTKNLGGFGDGGAINTNSEDLDKKIRVFRNYGSEKRYYNQVVGTNSRLDEIQAALLSVKLKHLVTLNQDRQTIASRYLKGINNSHILLPLIPKDAEHVWHQFVIRTKFRDQLMDHLLACQIQTIIHYPIPPHLSEAYHSLGYKIGDFPIAEAYADSVLSLPLFDGMRLDEADLVIKAINAFNPK